MRSFLLPRQALRPEPIARVDDEVTQALRNWLKVAPLSLAICYIKPMLRNRQRLAMLYAMSIRKK